MNNKELLVDYIPFEITRKQINESIKDNYHINSLPFSYLTAAVGSSGSAIAYDLRVVVGSGSNQDLTINSAYNESDGNTRQRTCSILQLWEIAA